MKKQILLYGWLLLGLFLFNACKDEENLSPAERTLYQNQCGYFILHEGTFGRQNAEVYFKTYATCQGKNQTEQLLDNLFNRNNGKNLVSEFSNLQSAFIHDKKMYLMAGQNVEIVGVDTYKKTATVEQVENARYGVVSGDKLYVSDWGNYDANFQTPNNAILVFNIKNNFSFIKKISLQADFRPEMLVAVGNKIFVATPGNPFGVVQKNIQVIDATKDERVASIAVADEPLAMLLDNQNQLWVLCGTNTIARVNPQTNKVEEKIDAILSYIITSKATWDSKKENIYFITDSGWLGGYKTAVYSFNTKMKSFQKITEGKNFYGIGFDAKNNLLLVTDHQGFSGKGKVHVFSLSGQNQNKSFEVGFVPNGFIF